VPLLLTDNDWNERAREAPSVRRANRRPGNEGLAHRRAAEYPRLAKLSSGRRAANRDVDQS
jgi:hypothetical protein